LYDWEYDDTSSTLTGLIRNSKDYKDGSKVTTSPIVGGAPKEGRVVITESGSKYFLDGESRDGGKKGGFGFLGFSEENSNV
jgi:hypothetical protein